MDPIRKSIENRDGGGAGDLSTVKKEERETIQMNKLIVFTSFNIVRG